MSQSDSLVERPWRRRGSRKCHFCAGRIPDDEKAVRAKTGNAWAHFECWYDGTPLPRDPQTGVLLSREGDSE